MEPIRAGLIGCGSISDAYLEHARAFQMLEVVACADLDLERARRQAEKFSVPKACRVEDLLADPQVEMVINLTVPAAHFEVSMAAIKRGKHVWTEKPLGIHVDEGRQLLQAARAAGVRLGGAPDTFLGAGQQTCRRQIDAGIIGRPVAATAFMFSPGHEHWHPNPAFYYQVGGGPVLDMAPYYLTALVNLLGPMRRVVSLSSIAIAQRTITSQPLHGTVVNVQVPDHVTGAIEFESGVLATIVLSFATWHAPHPPITIFGTQGTMQVPDPNWFDGEAQVRPAGWETEWQTLPMEHTLGYGRAVGAADMAHAIRSGRPHRGSAELIFGVLEAMQALSDAATQGQAVTLSAQYDRPAPLPIHLPPDRLDD